MRCTAATPQDAERPYLNWRFTNRMFIRRSYKPQLSDQGTHRQPADPAQLLLVCLHMSREKLPLYILFWMLTFAGLTLLSVYRQGESEISASNVAIWASPLAIGVAGSAYLATVKRVKMSGIFEIIVISLGVIISLIAPSTITRVIILVLFCALVATAVFKTRQRLHDGPPSPNRATESIHAQE